MCDRVYRISEARAWAQAEREGSLPLTKLDRRDGYVHLSAAAQVAGTLARYFAGRDDLLLLSVACERLIGRLVFERPSRPGAGDELFPHFYGRVSREAVVAVDPLPLESDGRHRLPAGLRRAIASEREAEGQIDLRVVWDPEHQLALVDYPRHVRIVDEAAIYAWEAVLERRVGPLIERCGGKVSVVVGLDNLQVATKVERRYAELADKVISRWFDRIARWTTMEHERAFFARINHARGLPDEVFGSLEQARAFVIRARERPVIV